MTRKTIADLLAATPDALLLTTLFEGQKAGTLQTKKFTASQLATIMQLALDSVYAKLASPTLTGTPTAPTASLGDNTTQLATTAFVQAAVAALLDSAPGALDTLNELAAALGDDANFAATMTTALAGKQALDSTLTLLSGKVAPYVLFSSGAGLAVPADTTEDILASITVPGHAMGANGFIRIHNIWNFTGSTNAKTMKTYFGNGLSGTLIKTSGAIATAGIFSLSEIILISNRNAENSQIVTPQTLLSGVGAHTAAPQTTSIDTADDQSITISGQKADSGENLTLEFCSVELFHKS